MSSRHDRDCLGHIEQNQKRCPGDKKRICKRGGDNSLCVTVYIIECLLINLWLTLSVQVSVGHTNRQ